MKDYKPVLDVCCGSRMFWFNKEDDRAVFCDSRKETHTLCDGRTLEINPDIQCDFRELPFEDGEFKLVVFDPPHLETVGDTSWLALKYGKLSKDWEEVLRQGFEECFRVLDEYGVLIFKWNETQIKTREILSLTPHKPLFGHISGKRANTHWIAFIKQPLGEDNEFK